MANVTLEGVKKIYDRQVVAVQEFNLSIADKEFVVFVGPSGCGKSTTLRMIAGLEDISEGTIRIGGRIVNDVEPKDRNIAMVFQNYALYPHLTVYENLAFSLRIRKMKQEEIHRRVCQAAEILGITPYLGRKPKALSGGQRQRVAIGRAIVRDADVFLMDEPLSNLDAKLRSQMRAEIILLRKRINTTFIYVTHDQTEAMTLGDRIVIMRDGFIQQVGTPQEVFDKPANLFVAGFIGSPPMNILPGQLVMNGGRCLLSLPGADIPLPERLEQELMSRQISPQNVLAGIRPEHVSVCFQPGPDALTGRITVQEMMGSELHLHVLLPGENKMVLRLPTMHLSSDQRALLQADQPVHFTLPGKALHLFDPQTEKNLLA